MKRLFFALLLIAPIAQAGVPVTVALNWVPEPEFGGIYAAQLNGTFDTNGLAPTIKPGGTGTPTWQLVANNQADFGICSADEVIVARAQGADIVAIFAAFQTNPTGLMVHESRGFKTIDEIFKSPGTLAVEPGLPYVKFLQNKYGPFARATVSYDGGVANFLADPSYAQQCFITAEPLVARAGGGDPKTFLVASTGYNPYAGVVVTSGRVLKNQSDVASLMFKSLQAGWRQYLDNPAPANAAMGKINQSMDAETFAATAKLQQSLIETDETKKTGLGSMTASRWHELTSQLSDLKVIDHAVDAADCYHVDGAPTRQ